MGFQVDTGQAERRESACTATLVMCGWKHPGAKADFGVRWEETGRWEAGTKDPLTTLPHLPHC